MATTTWLARDEYGELVTFRFCALAEYVREGGTFNDGEDLDNEDSPESHEPYVAACSVDAGSSGLPENDALDQLAGAAPRSYWSDNRSGYFLLREWPAEVPLEARLVGNDEPFDGEVPA